MSESTPSKKLQFTVVKASKLSKSRFPRRSKYYYASISVGSARTQTTKTVKSADPEWNESFIFDAYESSAVVIQIFNARKAQAEMIAEVTFTTPQCFQPGFQSIEPTCYNLLSPGSSSKRQGGTVIISCATSGANNAVAVEHHPTSVGSPSVPLTTCLSPAPVAKPEQDQAWLESFVHDTAGSSDLSTPSGVDTIGTGMDIVSGTTSSNSFNTVMGFVGRLVQIGDAVAKVHPYAKLAWTVLTAAQKTLKQQQDRDDKPLKAIEGLERTVQATMKQIYDCTLFLRSYAERSFIARTLQDTFTLKTDDAIQQFIDTFIDLKQRLRDRRDLDSWKIASTVKDGIVQLVATTDRLKEIGEFCTDIALLCSSHV